MQAEGGGGHSGWGREYLLNPWATPMEPNPAFVKINWKNIW